MEWSCKCSGCEHQMCTNRVPIFSSLSHEEMDAIQSLIIQRTYDKGEIIIAANEQMHAIFILNEGVVKINKRYQDKEQILYLLTENEFFGETNLFAQTNSNMNVVALTKTVLCTISKADFERLVYKYPSIGLKMLEEITHRLIKTQQLIENTGFKPIEDRIVVMLKEFAPKYGKEADKGTLIELPLNREELANYLGLTRETISRKLAKMDKEGLIKIIGHKKILLYHSS